MSLSNGNKELTSTADAELVRQAVDLESAEAFEELMSRYYERTYAIIFRMVRETEAARDLTQETFLKAWRGLSSYSGDAAFFTWLYRIARNLVNSEYRRLRVRPQVVMTLGDSGEEDRQGFDPQSAGESPEEELARLERREKITDAIAGLPPDFREIIVLRDLEKTSYDDIAELLEIPVGTVRSRLHRARMELKAKLSDMFD